MTKFEVGNIVQNHARRSLFLIVSIDTISLSKISYRLYNLRGIAGLDKDGLVSLHESNLRNNYLLVTDKTPYILYT